MSYIMRKRVPIYRRCHTETSTSRCSEKLDKFVYMKGQQAISVTSNSVITEEMFMKFPYNYTRGMVRLQTKCHVDRASES